MLFSKCDTLLTLTPGSSDISYLVTVGPFLVPATLPSTWNWASVELIISIWFNNHSGLSSNVKSFLSNISTLGSL